MTAQSSRTSGATSHGKTDSELCSLLDTQALQSKSFDTSDKRLQLARSSPWCTRALSGRHGDIWVSVNYSFQKVLILIGSDGYISHAREIPSRIFFSSLPPITVKWKLIVTYRLLFLALLRKVDCEIALWSCRHAGEV